MEDQEAPPAVDEPAPPAEAGGDDPPSGERRRGLPVVAVLAFTVVLVVFGAVMTVLFAQEAAARTDRDRTVAARSAELEAARGQLRAALNQAAQDGQNRRTLDPKGYDAIKACVQQSVDQHRKLTEQIQKFLDSRPDALPTGPGGTITATPFPLYELPGADFGVCELAAQYLK
jgi:hypothetical protein